MQPPAPAGWVSAPVDALRASTAIALPSNEPTYTFLPSALTVTTSGPSSARPVVQPEVVAPRDAAAPVAALGQRAGRGVAA